MFVWCMNQNNSELLIQGNTSSFHWSDQQCSKCFTLAHSRSQAVLGAVTASKQTGQQIVHNYET